VKTLKARFGRMVVWVTSGVCCALLERGSGVVGMGIPAWATSRVLILAGLGDVLSECLE
jgi:hypothetical protein